MRTLVADLRPHNPTRYLADGFRPLPPIQEALPALQAICRDDSVTLVMPCTDRELPLLSQHRAELEAAVAVCPPPLLACLRDKRTTHDALSGGGFPILPRVDPHRADVPYPLFGKPAAGWGSVGTRIVRGPQEQPAGGDWLWQRYLADFCEYSADFAIGFDGQVSPVTVRNRLATSGGYAVVSDTVDRPAVQHLVQRLAGWLAGQGGCGIFNVQVLETGDGLWVSDVNPRPGTSSVLSARVGNNLPLFMLRSLEPPSPPGPAPPMEEVRMVRTLEERWYPRRDLSRIRAVVLDLDETLVPQKRWILDKLQCMAHPALPPRSDLLSAAWHLLEEGERAHLFDALAGRFGWPPEVILQLIEAYRAACPPQCPLYPDVLKVLPELKRRGYRLALCSDNPPASQQQKLSRTPLAELLDVVVLTAEHGEAKPHETGFAEVSRQLGLAPETLAMVGDNPVRDLQGACSAGYGAGFWLQRQGGFFNFDRALVAELGPPRSFLLEIGGLHDLLAYLPHGGGG